ncbi:MAG: hydroxymethylbilane synthase, partial [Acetobacteraceae bacterium]
MSRLRTLDTPTAPRHARGQTLPLKVGTRGSPLALWQTRHFLSIISGFCPVLRNAEAFEEHIISTEGDRVQ